MKLPRDLSGDYLVQALCKHYGYLLAQSGSLQEAQVQYAKSIALRPNDAKLHFQLSEVLARQGKYNEAIEAAAANGNFE